MLSMLSRRKSSKENPESSPRSSSKSTSINQTALTTSLTQPSDELIWIRRTFIAISVNNENLSGMIPGILKSVLQLIKSDEGTVISDTLEAQVRDRLRDIQLITETYLNGLKARVSSNVSGEVNSDSQHLAEISKIFFDFSEKNSEILELIKSWAVFQAGKYF